MLDGAMARALWACTGICWTLQAFWPWTTTGVLSHSSPLDVVRMTRSGLVDALVPQALVVTLVAVPMLGLALVTLAGWEHRGAGATRPVVAALAVVPVATALALTARGGWGPGAWAGAAGTAMALGAALSSLRSRRTDHVREA